MKKILPNSCYKCDIAANRNNMVNGVGPLSSDIMIVGEAPGYHEDRKGLPFVGMSGSKLDELLYIGGFSRDNVFITNIIRCRPPDNRTPTVTEIENCKILLKFEIAQVKPKIIVTLGATPLKVFVNRLDIVVGDYVGKAIKNSKFILFPMYHPSYLIRGNDKERAKKMNKAIVHMYNMVEIYRNNFNQLHQSRFNYGK